MKNYSTSPFLPCWEYVPDGEPHIFGDRLYIFGSHDRFGGKGFCLNDYVCWSAPTSDLSDWRFDGVIYRKDQDPDNAKGKLAMWAPDVCQGPDGRFYLYYCLANQSKIGVAVSEVPFGPYSFLGYVCDVKGDALGTRPGDVRPFDPAVLVEGDGRVHLYSGQGPMTPQMVKYKPKDFNFAHYMELEPDMVTLRSEPHPVVPNVVNSTGTGFEGHEFFEASSIRKINGRYYFIYSSVLSHELCWAVSDRPDGGFSFGGTLISNGDIGLEGPVPMGYSSKSNPKVKNYIGNNHGSVECVNGKWYVFYHRQTNRNMYSRQACVARIEMMPDGRFCQAEMTSCGFSEALPGNGKYEARIACQLSSAEGCVFGAHPMVQNRKHPAFTQDEPDGMESRQYISNLREGASAVYKYFDLNDNKAIVATTRGAGTGTLTVSCDGVIVATIPIFPSKQWRSSRAAFTVQSGRKALTFTYHGTKYMDFLDFTLE